MNPISPFAAAKYGNVQTYILNADDRCKLVKTFTRQQCQDALAFDDLQTSVKRAINSRLAKLDKQGPAK